MLVCANKNKFSHGAALIASCMSESFQDYSVAQSVTCLTTDTCPTADPGVTSSIPARSHTFVEINHETIYIHSRRVLSVTRESMCTKYWLTA